MATQQTGQARTGTHDQTYDVVSVVYHALQGAENCRTYCDDAETDEARRFFEQAAQAQRDLADRGKQVLKQCLKSEAGDGAADSEEEGEAVRFEPDPILDDELAASRSH